MTLLIKSSKQTTTVKTFYRKYEVKPKKEDSNKIEQPKTKQPTREEVSFLQKTRESIYKKCPNHSMQMKELLNSKLLRSSLSLDDTRSEILGKEPLNSKLSFDLIATNGNHGNRRRNGDFNIIIPEKVDDPTGSFSDPIRRQQIIDLRIRLRVVTVLFLHSLTVRR